jgi:hypothetical protein
MINIQYLTSGILNTGYLNKNINLNNSKNSSKKIEYYRLSDGFKDANNSFINYVTKN